MVDNINRLAAKPNSSIERAQKIWTDALGVSPIYSAVSNNEPSANATSRITLTNPIQHQETRDLLKERRGNQ